MRPKLKLNKSSIYLKTHPIHLIQNLSGLNILESKVVSKQLRKKYPNRIVISLIFYYDKFKVNDLLGSQSGTHKIGAIYYFFPCIPPNVQSQLINIYISLLFSSTYRKKFGNRNTFLPLIKELRFLHTHPIYTTNKNIDICINCRLFVADNLGRYEISGFVESFSANYPCSTCKISRNELLICVLNEIEDFHILKNSSFDIMHDIYEGVSEFDLS
ncbi:uncharacterized protein [Cardiocondyla obscurior]|uniref:uncharacterized protein n=1 Tax=Cardiocondyla obscurior TaxID=286306 RepID=UPI00396568C0